MPSVLSTLFSAPKRVYVYGAIVAISTIGLIHFKQNFTRRESRDEIQILSQQTNINKMDLITTELPLLIAPFAGIDAIHYATEIVYDLVNTHTVHPDVLQRCALSGLLGFGLPIVYVFRNKNMSSSNGIRSGVKRFVYHIASVASLVGWSAVTYRFMLWSLKYSLSTPFFVVGSVLLYKLFKQMKSVRPVDEFMKLSTFIRLTATGASFAIGSKVYFRMREYEKYRMNKIYDTINTAFFRIWSKFIWHDVDMKYVLFSGIFIANLFNFLMDSVVSKYFMPFSFKIRNKFLEQNNNWIYDSYYHYMSDANTMLPKSILWEIFSFAAIEEDFRLWIGNDQCRIQYEEKHLYVQELSILAHICFSYVSYRELYQRIKCKTVNINTSN
eukprot:94793_1